MIMEELMPKYRYGCNECNREWWEWGSVGDQLKECPHCSAGKPIKLPVDFIKIDNPVQEKKSSKQNVVDHIEKNKKILKDMRRQASEEQGVNND